MNKQTAQRRLEVTQRQVGLLEQCIADAKASKTDMDLRVYRAMIAGYRSQRDELQAEAKKYREQLSK